MKFSKGEFGWFQKISDLPKTTTAKKDDNFAVGVLTITWLVAIFALFKYVSKPITGDFDSYDLVALSALSFLLAAPLCLAIDFFGKKRGCLAKRAKALCQILMVLLILFGFIAAANSQTGYCNDNFSECLDW